ncbi:glycosyltransferase family protein [Sphingobacterium pedocola]|uniref:Glycosyl transferase n=1 Tax=Sphingobacterium pedocola TaxID=2082722 RepID=A0ABR9T819_9SPHI|nr:glycosyltransferase family protein [Sphingobacterium pedocola]MBE8721501.1 glycosyl transferase [Sphingobacterium pedocola]
MKILYAIQGTGNGHISRARDIIPLLQRRGEVDILISGTEADVELGCPVKYTLKGLSFVFGKKGGVDLVSTYQKAKIKRFYNELKSLSVLDYDLVISDFEPVSAWACRQQHKACYALSHQSAVLNKNAPYPEKFDPVGKWILKNYAPTTSQFGFHFMQYDKHIFTPLIRQEIRNATVTNEGHYTVYLPAYSDKKMLKVLGEIKSVKWQVFSKHTKQAYDHENIKIFPVCNSSFIKSMVSSAGVICGAGFETPAEALFLKKKLIVIPMKGQYEQQCNAAALQQMNVPILKKLSLAKVKEIKKWLETDEEIVVNFPDCTEQIIATLFADYLQTKDQKLDNKKTKIYSFKQIRNHLFKNTPLENYYY